MAKIALQLWSLRDDAKADFPKTLAAVAKLGYEAVEFAGLNGHSAKDLRKILDDVGLVCAGAHVGIENFHADKVDQMIADYATLGAKFAFIPWLGLEKRDSRATCQKTLDEIAPAMPKLKAAGMRTGYHLHDGDVKALPDGKSSWQHLIDLTDESFLLQHDTGNAMHGGMSATWSMEHHPRRCPSVHFKEFPLDGSAIGEGQVPWKSVIEKCRSAGTEFYVIEHEVYQKYPPMKAVEVALTNLKKLL